MEPVTVTIVSALAAGAAAGANKVATKAIKDAYAGLKRLITDRYQGAAPFLEAVQADPASEPEQSVLAKQLDRAGAAKDHQLKAAAQALLDAVAELRAKPKAIALFDFDRLKLARNAKFKDIHAAQVLRVRGTAKIGGDLTGEGLRQEPGGESAEKN